MAPLVSALLQGVLLVNDAYRATLQYSIPKDGSDRQSKASQDWICVRVRTTCATLM